MDSEIVVNSGGTTFAGPDAASLFAAIAMRGALRMYHKCKIIPSRGVTPTKMLASAGRICGKTYKRGQYQQAIDDLTVWIETMKSALPIRRDY